MTSSNSTPLEIDDNDRIWDLITECLERFVAEWERAAAPPPVCEFLPDADWMVRRLAAVELVKVDLEFRGRDRATARCVEDYLQELPELSSAEPPLDLIYEEYHIRRQAGETVDVAEYFQRFPQQEEPLRRLLGLESPQVSTALFTASRPDDVHCGEQLDDFELLTELGQGAFAKVFLARQKSMQRMVAVKISADQGVEPQTLAQLDHPHIVRIYDQRIVGERRLRLLYMKYLAGGTLHDVIHWSRQYPSPLRSGATLLEAVDRVLDLRGESPPSDSPRRAALMQATWWETVCRIGMELADALQYAHSAGVLHRDLKPANILMSAEASPQLVDFNISYSSKVEGASPAGYFGGSLAYMSPEQLEACNPHHDRTPDELGGQIDTYSLGIVLWEMLAGKRPFADKLVAESWSTTLAQMAVDRRAEPNASQLRASAPGCPAALVAVLLKSLASEPSQRYQSAGELAADLQLCTHPAAERLLRPPPGSRSAVLRRFAIPIIVAAMLIPNVLASWFNMTYNEQGFLNDILPADSKQLFVRLKFVINGIAFPVGLTIVMAIFWPVIRAALGKLPADRSEHATLRRRALRMGHWATLVCIAEWVIAGMIYPLVLMLGNAPLGVGDVLHLLSSLSLCGMIVATYPFFGVTTYTVHCLYPRLLETSDICCEDEAELAWLESATWFYLGLGFLLPMFGLALIVGTSDERLRVLLSVVSIGSLIGCGILYLLARRLQRDVAIFQGLIRSNRSVAS